MEKLMKKTKGFTVVELVIVIAVIGVLSAILISTFVNLVDKANIAAEQEEARNSYASFAAEYADQSGILLDQNEVALNKTTVLGAGLKWDGEKSKWVDYTIDATDKILQIDSEVSSYVLVTATANAKAVLFGKYYICYMIA